MALAFYVSSPEGLATAFAAHDEYSAIFSHFFSGRSQDCTLTPNDTFYSAPYCFMPKQGRCSGFLVFTAQVPWLHGNPCAERGDDHHRRRYRHDENDDSDDLNGGKRAHHQARTWMEKSGKLNPPHIGTVEEFQASLSLKEEHVYTFTRDGGYPTKEDISCALEDIAIEVSCKAMGWKIPKNWRLHRKPDLHGLRILDLAEWDRQQQAQNQQQQIVEHRGSNAPSSSSSSRYQQQTRMARDTNNTGETNYCSDEKDKQTVHTGNNDRSSKSSVQEEEKKDCSYAESADYSAMMNDPCNDEYQYV